MSYFSAKRIGEMLAMVRVSAGLSQTDMARRINKGRATVQSWECGASSPPADKIMDWFEACGCSPLAPFQEMLHPDLYRKPTSALPDEELDAALAAYFDTAPRMIKEMLLFIILGEHGSYPPAAIAEVCANLHTPLQNKVSVCAQVIDNYTCAVDTRTDPVPDAPHPPLELLRDAYKAGKQAARSGKSAYTTKRGEKP